MRTALPASFISLGSLAAVLLVGCVLGEGNAPPPADTPDAAPAVPDATPPPDAAPPITCKNAQPTMADGHHHPGLDCDAGNCHGPAGDAPKWTISGTLYKDIAGTIPDPYAVITVVDATGTSLDLITALNGNFYTSATLVAPLTVRGSKCPDLAPMVASVQFGTCNSCHKIGATQGPIHLP